MTIDQVVLDKDRQRLARNSAKAIAGTLLSRSLGVIRTIIINVIFGVNTNLDAFNAAFRFPNSLRDLFADGALSAAFIKALIDTEPEGEAAIRKLISMVSGFFLSVTLLLSLLGFFFARPFMDLISGDQFAARDSLHLASILFQILVFYLPLTMLNAVVMAVLGIKGDTFRAMNGSLFLSVGMIIGALLLAPLLNDYHYSPVLGLAIGATIGAILQLVYQAYPLIAWNYLVWPNLNPLAWWSYPPLGKVIRLMTPRAIGQGALVLALMVNTFFAIQIAPGALTYVTTTIIIIQVPIGLFGVSTGFAALPQLSSAFNNNNPELFKRLLEESLHTARWLSLFTVIGLALLIVPFYMLIFQHGRITFYDSIQNSIAICAYGIGIFFAANGKVLTNALYAVNATKQIVVNAIIYLLVNVTLSALLAPAFGLIGLGCSFATAAATDCWLNYFVVNHRVKAHFSGQEKNFIWTKDSGQFFFLSVLSYLIGFSGIGLCKYFWPNFLKLTTFSLNNWSALCLLIFGGILLLSFFMIISRRYGPAQLQHLIRKLG